MKIKSLLLGSAAALVAAPAAYAADVIVPEPEMVEYVRICDAAGTGYFYIPGTEVCLKISGYVNYDFEFAEGTDARDDDWEARLQFDAWTDTEYGPLVTRIRTTAAGAAHEIVSPGTPWPSVSGATSGMNVDRAYFEIAGLRLGVDASAYDFDISGETDGFGAGNNTGVIRYTATVGANSIFVSVENDDQVPFPGANNWTPNVVAGISGSMSDVSYTLAVAYDEHAWSSVGPFVIDDMWSAKGIVSFMGFNVGAQYTSDNDPYGVGTNAFAGPGEWYVAASYDFHASDKLLITPAVEYANNTNFKIPGSPSMWGVGVTAKYNITDTLWVRGHIEYNDPSTGDGTWKGQIRFRSEF